MTQHIEASIEGKAASIPAKGLLQNLVVEPELDPEGAATGFYFVTIGEGRNLARLPRAKRKQIKKMEPIRSVIDTQNDPAEIGLDENANRKNLHRADEFERFSELAENRGRALQMRRLIVKLTCDRREPVKGRWSLPGPPLGRDREPRAANNAATGNQCSLP
jgi:hypothetical protein